MTPIVIGNYNKPDLTQKCLTSIREHTDNYSIIVVDNGDHHLEDVGKANWILSDKPLGFTRAYNEGIRWAKTHILGWDHICLMNNDVVVNEDWLPPLIEAIKSDEKIAIVAPIWKDPLNTDSISVPAHSDIIGGHNYGIYERSDSIEKVWSVNFTCVLINRAFIDDFGLMDETMHTFCSDIDYSLRAIQAGWTNLICEKSMVWHELNQTVGDEKLFNQKEKEELIKKDQITLINKWTGQFFNEVLEVIPLDNRKKMTAKVYFLIADPDGAIIKWGERKAEKEETILDTQNIRAKFDQIKRMGIDE